MNASVYRYHMNNTQTTDGNTFKSELTGWNLFKNTILSLIVIPITLGFAMPWMVIRFKRLYIESTSIEGELNLRSVIGKGDGRASAMADGFSDISDALDTLGEFLGG
jgi:uncharacterized membrane protein YjgN (DUF898 family)